MSEKYGDDWFWAHIEGLESRKDRPNVPNVPPEIMSREQANHICLNARAMLKELEDRDASFDLRWKADMRAIRMWQLVDPKQRNLTWPDHADLCVWLLEKLDLLEKDGVLDHIRELSNEGLKAVRDACQTELDDRKETWEDAERDSP